MALLTPVGTLLKIATAGASLDDLAEVTAISGPSPSVEGLDSTELTSGVITRIAGRTDWGNVSLTLNLSKTNASEVYALGSTLVDWSIVIPDASATSITIAGSAVCGQLSVSVASGSVVTATLELQCSGAVTITEQA